MRKFEVFLDKKLAGVDQTTEIIEFPDDASDKEIEETCNEVLQSMIENELYTGWDEI